MSFFCPPCLDHLNFPEYQSFSRHVSSSALSCNYKVYSSASNYPLQNSGGSYMMYGVVTERKSAGKEQGKTVYSYSFSGDANASSAFPYPPASSLEWRRGLLLSKQVYAGNASGQEQLVLSEENDYEILPQSQQLSYGFKIGPKTTYSQFDSVAYSWQTMETVVYPIIAESYQIRSKTTKQYAGNRVFQTTESYGYTPRTYLPNKTVSTASDGSAVLRRTYYPTDYQQNAGRSPLLTALLSAHVIGVPIEQTLARKTTTGLRLAAGTVHQYAAPVPTANLPSLYLHKTFALQTGGTADTLARYDFLQLPAHYKEEVAIEQVTSNGRPLSLRTKGHAIESYKWGYDEQLVIAQCKNARATEVFVENFEEDPTAVEGAAHTGTRFATAYTVSWVPPTTRAYWLSYWYRQGGSWRRAVQTYTGSSATLHGGDAYDDVSIYPQDAQLILYTHNPLVGITSQTGPDGRTSFYEYDALSRLLRVRDEQGRILSENEYQYAQP